MGVATPSYPSLQAAVDAAVALVFPVILPSLRQAAEARTHHLALAASAGVTEGEGGGVPQPPSPPCPHRNCETLGFEQPSHLPTYQPGRREIIRLRCKDCGEVFTRDGGD